MLNKLGNMSTTNKINSVYNYDEYSIQELLSKFYVTINESVDVSNNAINMSLETKEQLTKFLLETYPEFAIWLKNEGIPIETQRVINDMYLDGRLATLLNEGLLLQLNYSNYINRLDTKFMLHRGASATVPEETRPSFELASQLGVKVVEFDIRLTKDEEFILQHDETLDRITSGSGNVINKTLSEILSLDIDGGNNISSYPNLKVLTFEQAVSLCKKNNLGMMIDFKNFTLDEKIYQKAINIIKAYGMTNKCMIATYYSSQAIIIKRLAQELSVGIEQIGNEVEWNNLLNFLDFALLEKTTVTENVINRLHSKNKKIIAYTVNTMEEVQKYERMGVDFFMTDLLIDGGF